MTHYFQHKALVFKTRWMTVNGFYFSEKELEESALTQYLNDPKELDDEIIFVPYAQIKKATPIMTNQPPLLDIEVKDDEAYTAVVADFENKEQVQEAIKSIEKYAGLKESVEILKDKSWLRNLMYTVVVGIFGYSLIMIAQEIAAGETLNLSGRRSGLKKLLASIAEQLGVIGSTIVALLIVGYFAYNTYKAYQSSNVKQVTWK